MRENDNVLLSVKGLTKRFKTRRGVITAAKDVSFTVDRGEILGLVGESGSGKSTLGRMVAGLVLPDGGEIAISGERIRVGEDDIKEKIGKVKANIRENRREISRLKKSIEVDSVGIGMLEYENNHLQEELNLLEMELGEAVRVRKKWRKRAHPDIRMVFQDPTASLNPRMTVKETVSEALLAIGERDTEVIDRRVAEVLDAVGMPKSSLGRYPHEFSGGQKQRIGIARAVITRPALLIADEPLSALDVSVGAQVANLILDLSREMGMSVLFIAHDLSLVKRICHRVAVMYKGRMVELAPSDELFLSPLHPYTRSLISAIPMPDPRTAKTDTRVEVLPEGYIPSGEFSHIGGGHYVLTEK